MRKALATLGILLGFWATAGASTFTVTSTADSGPGSLRQSILDAEAAAGPDEITLGGVTGTITLESILPTLAGELTITGPGAAKLKISGNNRTQLLLVDPTGKLTLSGLTLADGRAEAYLHGGAIQNRGTLVISDCAFSNNHAYGGFGGAIYSEGALTISGATFTANHVTGGSSVGSGPSGAFGGGGGGFGGAIYVRQGTLTLSDSSFDGNFAIGGSGETPFSAGGPAYAAGTGGGPEGGAGGGQDVTGMAGGFGSGGGGGGNGGGFNSSSPGGSGGAGGFGGGGGGGGAGGGAAIFSSSGGVGGFGGGYGVSAFRAAGHGGGGAAFGGAIFIENGITSITRVTMIANHCSGGVGGTHPNLGINSGANGGGGGAGMGAAVFQYSGTLGMKECLLEANSVTGGNGGGARNGGGRGASTSGAAVFAYGGSCTIAQSTLSTNLATGGAGGFGGSIGGDASGGAIASSEGEVTLTNCTISGNRAFAGSGDIGSGPPHPSKAPGLASGGAIRTGSSLVSLVNCTIANNEAQAGVTWRILFDQIIGEAFGGGIYVTGIAPRIQNSLFAGNQLKVILPNNPLLPPPPNPVVITKSDGKGTFNSIGYNLVETSAGIEGLVASDKRDIAAQLGPLGDNGGFTPTHPILPGSPALDGGTAANAPATDQRGETRPQGPAFDIGAYERSAPSTFTVTSTADSGAGSLRQAILDAEAAAGPDEVTFAGVTGTITLESILPTLAGELTITGPGAATLKISGNNRTQLLVVDPTGKLTLSGLTLADGRAEAYLHGGAIQNRGTLTISDCAFSNNHAYGGFGGAIYSDGTLTISGATFATNHVTGGGSVGSGLYGALGGGGGGFGGAIYVREGTLTLSDSSFDGNFAVGGHGDSPFSAGGPNYASGTGGGPGGGAGGGQGSPTGLRGLPGGFGSGGGGGGLGTVVGSSATGGSGGAGGFGGGGGGGGPGSGAFAPAGGAGGAGGFGGGEGARATTGSGQPGGGGAAFGGAIFMENGISSITRVTMIANNCTGGAGGNVPNGLGTNGVGGGGGAGMGAAVFQYSGTLEMKECLLEANSATGGRSGFGRVQGGLGAFALGGAVFSYGGTFTIAQSTLSRNLATGGAGGGGVFRGGIGGDASGGAIASSEGEITLTNCTISGNRVFAGSGDLGTGGSSVSAPGLASGGAIRTGAGLVSLVNCTIANNEAQAGVTSNFVFVLEIIVGDAFGGGIYATGIAPRIQNTLLAGNQLKVIVPSYLPPGPDRVTITKSDGKGTFNSGGYNLVETSAGIAGLVASDKRDIASQLGPLGDNGGFTPTHPILPGSPALDGGTAESAPATDQRGETRPQGLAVDIGAFELAAVNLTITTSGQGTVTTSPPAGPYATGGVVTLTARPATGWMFQGWSGDLSGNASPATITMDAGKAVHGTFVQIPSYSLTVTQSGQGNVSISPESGPYLEGATVTLNAQPSQGWAFDGWVGSATGSQNLLAITMDADKTIQATFRRIVAFTATTQGGGTINLTPNTPPYLQGQTVTATAQPGAGWQFLSWRGDVESTDRSIQVLLDADTSIEAVFGTTITLNPIGNGSIVAQPSAAIYPFGTTIRLTGIPSPGQRFSFWGPPINSESNPVDYTVTQANATIPAAFEAIKTTLTISIEGNGNVSASPTGNVFPIGTTVTLTAASPAGHVFAGWSGDASGSQNPLTLVMDASKVIVAKFHPVPHTSIAYRSSEQVPGEPAGTTFASFGAPAINEAGQFAFSTEIVSQGIKTRALFAAGRIVAREGAAAPDKQGNSQSFFFTELLDPVIDENGHVAFIGTTGNPNGGNSRRAIWTDAGDSILRAVAWQGSDAAGIADGKFLKFKSVSLQKGQLLFTATVQQGGGINAANDRGVWTWDRDAGLGLQLREGVTLVAAKNGSRTVKSFAVLVPIAGSLSQGGTHVNRDEGNPGLAARVKFTDNTEAILTDDGSGKFKLEVLASSGMRSNIYTPDAAISGFHWKSFGFPSWSMDGTRLGFRANMQTSNGIASKGSGLFVDGSEGRLSLRVRKGDPAPGPSASLISGASFASFKDPVIGGSPVEFAFVGKLAGSSVTTANDDGLWVGTSNGLKLGAREGDAADAPLDARWKAIQSVALGFERGPVFVATLAPGFGGVTPATKRGLWGTDSSGQLWPLLRQGDSLQIGEATIQVQRFTALSSASGAEGTVRGLSASGAHILVQAQLSDGTQALLKIEMP